MNYFLESMSSFFFFFSIVLLVFLFDTMRNTSSVNLAEQKCRPLLRRSLDPGPRELANSSSLRQSSLMGTFFSKIPDAL